MVLIFWLVLDDIQIHLIKHIYKCGHFTRKCSEADIKEYYIILNLAAKIDKVLSNCVTFILHNHK